MDPIGEVPPQPFVKPVRIPGGVEWQVAAPPFARAGEQGTWRLRFVVSEDVPEGAELHLLCDGGRHVKGSFRPVQVDQPDAPGHLAVWRETDAQPLSVSMAEAGTAVCEVPQEGIARGEALVAELRNATPYRFSLPNKMFLLYVTEAPVPMTEEPHFPGEVGPRT